MVRETQTDLTSDPQVTAEACRGCIIDDLEGALELLAVPEAKQREVLSNAHHFLEEEFDLSRSPS